MSSSLLQQQYKWIDSDAELERCAGLWSQKKLIALDTEFMRSKTYYPCAGLIQINDGDASYLIDPLKVNDYFPLVEIFDNAEIAVALHSCSEDLDVLNCELACIPANIFDTQVACALLGKGFSLSYANAVKSVLDVELPKSETRSDWLARPLSEAQIYYAALDVEYLLHLSLALQHELSETQRQHWMQEEREHTVRQFKTQQDADQAYLRIKSAWKLDPKQLAVLRALARWRENAAQERDLPRNHVLKENVLFGLALRCPEQERHLRVIDGIQERTIRRDGEHLLRLIADALQSDPDSWPAPMPPPLTKEEQAQVKELRAVVQEIAEKNNVAPEMLMKKKEYEQIVRLMPEYTSASELPVHGWREDILADALRKKLAELRG